MCASLRPRTCSLMLNRLRDTAFRRLLLDPILEIDTRSTLFTAPVGLLSLIIGSLGAGVAVRDNGNGVSSVTLALVVFFGGCARWGCWVGSRKLAWGVVLLSFS